MSRFYASIKGNRGEVTRTGTVSSGITGHIRGWNIGVKVHCYIDAKGRDAIEISRTGGSSKPFPQKLISIITEDV